MRLTIFKPILFLLIVCTNCCAQYQQKPAAVKQSVIQRPYYGPEINPLKIFIHDDPAVVVKTDTAQDMPYEYGYVFQASKNGLIVRLGVQMPNEGAVYTVSLWDYQSQQLIKQYTVTVHGSGFSYADLQAGGNAVPVVAGKKYVVSVFSGQSDISRWPYCYILKRGNSNTAASFLPLTIGTVTILNGQFTITPKPAFPSTTVYHTDILNGLCDIGFKPTEK